MPDADYQGHSLTMLHRIGTALRRLEANRNLLTAMSLLPKSIHRYRRYPTKFKSGRDIPPVAAGAAFRRSLEWVA